MIIKRVKPLNSTRYSREVAQSPRMETQRDSPEYTVANSRANLAGESATGGNRAAIKSNVGQTRASPRNHSVVGSGT